MGHADDSDEILRCPESFPSIPGAYVRRYGIGDNLNVLHRRCQENAELAWKTLDTVLGAPEISDRALVRNRGVNDLDAKISCCHIVIAPKIELPTFDGTIRHSDTSPSAEGSE